MPPTVLLLGSGVSFDAGVPGVSPLTEQVLSGAGTWRHTDGTYLLHDNPNAREPLYRQPVDDVLALLHALPPGNYEQLALLVQQLRDAPAEYETAAVFPFTVELARRLQIRPSELASRCFDADNYITDTVCAMLVRGDMTKVDHLSPIVELCRQRDTTLATLNHDLLLEAALNRAGVQYADGFADDGWADDFSGDAIPLLKLHGSIDWWQTRDRRDVRGSRPPDAIRPRILTGTFTKILAYGQAVIADQHLRFGERLREARHVIVIGYGFGDKAINSRLIHWMDRDAQRRITIADPNAATLNETARPAIGRSLGRWDREGRLKLIVQGVGELEANDLAL